jgi:hypothetical protein
MGKSYSIGGSFGSQMSRDPFCLHGEIFCLRTTVSGEGRKISPRTVNAARQGLFVPLQHAVDMGEFPYHPGCRRADLPFVQAFPNHPRISESFASGAPGPTSCN